MALRSIRSTKLTTRTALRSPGTGFPGCWAASAGGRRTRASSITRICAPSTGESPSLVSTSPTFRLGRRVPFCPRSTQSRDCTGAWWRADHGDDRGRVAARGARNDPHRIYIGRERPVVRRLVHERTALHAARWRGDLSHRVPELPYGSRAGRGRGWRLSGTRQRSKACRGRIFSAGRGQRLEGYATVRRTARLTSRWRPWSITSAHISETLTQISSRRST